MLEGAATTYPPGDAFFDALDPFEHFGLAGAVPEQHAGVTDIPGLARSTGPGGSMQTAPLWSPQNPLFVFGLVLAATTGLVAFSTSFNVRAGKQRARASVGVGKA